MFDAVADVNAPVLERPAFEQFEIDLTVHRVEQGDSRSEENRVDVEADLVNEPGFEKRPGQLPASHDADVLSVLSLQVLDELGRILTDNRDTLRGALGQASRKDIRFHTRVAPTLLAAAERNLVRLPPHHDRI